MRRFVFGAVVGFLLATYPLLGAQIPDPTPIKDKEILFYLRRIARNWQNMTVVTADPNGSRIGRSGDIVIWNDSGTYRWRVNTSSTPGTGTTWTSVTS